MSDTVATFRGSTFIAARSDLTEDPPPYALRIADGRGGRVFVSLAEVHALRTFIDNNFLESE